MQIGVWFRSLGGWASSPCHFALLEITMPSQARYRTDWRRHRCTRGWLACAHFIFPGRGCVQNNANICKHERKVANKKSVTQVILRGLEFEWSTVSERAHVVGTAFFSSQIKWEKKWWLVDAKEMQQVTLLICLSKDRRIASSSRLCRHA